MRSGPLLLALALLPLASTVSAGGADGTAAKDPRNLTWVTPGVLAIGGGGLNESEVDWLYGEGFRAIADFRIEHQDPAAHIAAKGMAFFDLPIDSASHINETQLASFVAWAREQQAAGRPVYIHCTNGWHRAAAFAVAWDMATTGEPFDEAAREQVARRPGSVMRATSGLLDYQATLAGERALAVMLVSPISRPAPNGTMEVSVDVLAAGAPAANASVRVWSEETKLRAEGVTDAQGRFTFTYAAPEKPPFMDHVYARASLAGFADGADNIEFLYGEPVKQRGPLAVVATRVDGDLVVEATANGKPTAARVVVTAPGWTAFEASIEGRVRFPDVPTDAITVRAVAWGAEYGFAEVPAIAPPPPAPEPEPAPEPAPVVEPPAPEPAPAVDPAPAPASSALRPRWQDARLLAASAAGVAALGTGLFLFTRRRAPS